MSNTAVRLGAALAGRYTIERELGAGGMATVYLARDLKHDRDVALKVLKPELAAVLGAERFVVEIKTTAALQHPHILPLFDSGGADGFLYYVMPFIDGETLRAKLDRETQLGVDEAVKIATEVADALHYAHEHGVIHRDIKPENILLANGRPMVADFGIALAVSAAAGGRMTETGLSLGTPHYKRDERIWMQPFDGGGGPIQVSVGLGEQPRWSRTGRTLYYISLPDRTLVAATFTGATVNKRTPITTQMASMGTERDAMNWDIFPDGTRAIFIQPILGGPAPKLAVVQHWPALLRAMAEKK